MLTTQLSARRRVLRLALAPYWQLARRSFQRYATYRGATFAGVFTNTVFGFLRGYVFLALYRHRTQVGGLGPKAVITYAFVAQGMLAMTWAFGNTDISDRIRTGDIVSDLYRPLRFQAYWMAQNAGRAGFQAFFRGIPPVLCGALAFRLQFPDGPGTIAAFVLSVALAVQVGFACSFAIQLSGFWLIDTRGVAQIATMAIQFFSGFLVPISFFPAALYHVARLLPFASMFQYPIEIFLGRHPGAGAAGILAQQLAWVTVLTVLNEWITARALHKVVVQGG